MGVAAASLEAAMAVENRNQLLCAQSPDAREGMRGSTRLLGRAGGFGGSA